MADREIKDRSPDVAPDGSIVHEEDDASVESDKSQAETRAERVRAWFGSVVILYHVFLDVVAFVSGLLFVLVGLYAITFSTDVVRSVNGITASDTSLVFAYGAFVVIIGALTVQSVTREVV